MARLRRILRGIREAISWLGLPDDMRTLWGYLKRLAFPVLSAGFTFVVAWAKDAPLWQIAVLTAIVFIVVYAGIAFVDVSRRRALASAHTEPPPTNPEGVKRLNDEDRESRKQLAKAATEAGLPPNVATERRIANCEFRIHDLLKLAGTHSTIEGKEFENCTIRGPATITTARPPRTPEKGGGRGIVADVFHTPTLYVEGKRDSVLREVPSGGATASGVIHLVGCSYKRVTLSGIVIVGNANELNWWRENATFSGSGE